MAFSFLVILAQQADPGQQPPWWSFLVMWAPILLIGYLLLMRPQMRQEQQRREMITKLKKGDRIENQGGILGVVDAIKDDKDEVILKGGTHIRKSSIVRIIPQEEAKD